MHEQQLDRSLSATIEIPAIPEAVWSVVADLRRTGEWSPECSRVLPLGDIRQGGWFVGINRRKWVRWPTVSRVVRHDPHEEIAWKVLSNRAVWSYRLQTTEGGTRLTETRETPQGLSPTARAFTRVLLGGRSTHDEELQVGMTQGLERIKRIVQA